MPQLQVFHTHRYAPPASVARKLALSEAMSAAYAADGYARAAGEPAVVVAADEVEALEALTALPCSWGDRIPLVVVCRLDAARIPYALDAFREVTRHRIAVRVPADLAGLGDRVRQALDLDAPVLVAAAGPLADPALAAVAAIAPPAPPALAPDPGAVRRFARALEGAWRPLLVVGRRAALEVDPADVAALARKLVAPAALTIDASSLPKGRLAQWAQAFAPDGLLLAATNMAWAQSFLDADRILALDGILSEGDLFGLNDYPMHEPPKVLLRVAREDLKSAELAQEVSFAELGAFVRALEAEVGPPWAGLRLLRRRWLREVENNGAEVKKHLDEIADRDAQKDPPKPPAKPTVEPTVAARAIAAAAPPAGALLITEGNATGMWTWSYLFPEALARPGGAAPLPSAVVHPGLMANIGIALHQAAGVQLAARLDPVWAILGDGSLLYQLRMLGELRRLRDAKALTAPLVVFVFGNGAWDAIRLEQTFFFESDYVGTQIPPYDFAGLARLYGCEAMQVAAPQDLGPALQMAAARKPGDPPLLVDIAMPRDRVPFAGLSFALAELDFASLRLGDRLLRSIAALVAAGRIPKDMIELVIKLVAARLRP